MGYGRLVVGPSAATELIGLFEHQLGFCNLKQGELCIIVTDTAYNPVYAAACQGAAMKMGAEVYQMVLPYTHPLPTKSLGGAWSEADLVVFPTTHTLHYSSAMREALDNGSRALAVMQPLHVIQRLTADEEVIQRTKAGQKLMHRANKIRITSDAGTDLVMDKTGRDGTAAYGAADEPGHLDFWGGGLVETAQLEGTLEGQLVMDRGDICFHLGRFIDEPVTITFREGKAVQFEGGLDAFLIRTFLESMNDEASLRAGHTSWGTDHRAQWLAQAIQFPEPGAGGSDTEAHYGNVQIEIGSNTDIKFQGKNAANAHLGLCMLNSSLYLDDQPIIEYGEFVPAEMKRKS